MFTVAVVVTAVLLTVILPIYPQGITPEIAVFLALAGIGGGLGLLHRAARRELLVLTPWALAIGLALVVGSLRNGEAEQAIEDTLPYMLFALGLFAGRGLRNPRPVLVAALAVCATDAAISIYKMPSYEIGMRSTYNYFRIIAGLPLLGLFISPVLRYSDPKGRSPSLLKRPVHAALYVVMLAGVFFSVSRGMMLGFLVGTMVAVYIRKPSQVLLGSIILVGMAIVYSSAAQELGVKYMRFEAASTVQGRFREIETAWLTFVEYPLFGAGLGAMFEVDGFYKAFVHNMAMYHLWKFGLVGTAMLVGPLVMIGRQLRSSSPRLRSYAIGGALGVTAYLVTCAAYKTYYLVWIYGVVIGAGVSWLSAWRMRQDAPDPPVSEA